MFYDAITYSLSKLAIFRVDLLQCAEYNVLRFQNINIKPSIEIRTKHYLPIVEKDGNALTKK